MCVCVGGGGGGGGGGKLTQKTDFTWSTFHYNYAIFSTVLLILRECMRILKACLERQKEMITQQSWSGQLQKFYYQLNNTLVY